MLNQMLFAQIQKSPESPKAMVIDRFENPRSYKGWILPLRYLLALRYMKNKQKVLEWFRYNKTYPIADEEYKEALIQQLLGKKKYDTYQQESKGKLFVFAFKAVLLYPAILIALGVGAYSLNYWYKLHRIENALANHLPYYSDLLHRKLMLTDSGNEKQRKKLDAVIEIERKKILGALPEKNGIRKILADQLEKLKDPSSSSEEIMYGFKEVNTVFDKQGLPYYLTPKSFSMPCSSLINASVEQMMMIKKLEELMSGNDPELCRTTMVTIYKVNQRGQLYYTDITGDLGKKNLSGKKVELPLFHVERVDKVPAIDSALGLTFKEHGIGSIILRDRIKLFGEESVLPALTFMGRSYIIPYWMQGYYEIEEVITKGYKKDIYKIYPKKSERIKVRVAIKKVLKNKNRMLNAKMQQTLQRPNANSDTDLFGSSFDAISVLLGKKRDKQKPEKKKKIDNELDNESKKIFLKLEAVLLPSIEIHEAYHQIDKRKWKQPSWVKEVFKDELTTNGTDHTLEELGAYLTQLSKTEEGLNIWLSKLLIFSLNPMTKGQAEYYASSIIFSMMNSLDVGEKLQPNYNLSVDEKTEIYKKLIDSTPDEIRYLAKRSYEILFERDVPEMVRD